jgi:hypothetical protein
MTAFYAITGLIVVWSSLGPAAGLYSVLYYTIPVFSLLRAPARFGVGVPLILAVLSAIGVGAVLAAQPARRRTWLSIAAVSCVLLDLSTTMATRVVPPQPRAYQVLAQARPGVVVEFPFFHSASEYYRHAQYMLHSTAHWLPLVNGYSDFIPQDFSESALPIASFPNPEGFHLLRERRARYAVFHLKLYDWRNRNALLQRLDAYGEFLQPLVKEEDVWLFEIVRWPETHPVLSSLNPAPKRRYRIAWRS